MIKNNVKIWITPMLVVPGLLIMFDHAHAQKQEPAPAAVPVPEKFLGTFLIDGEHSDQKCVGTGDTVVVNQASQYAIYLLGTSFSTIRDTSKAPGDVWSNVLTDYDTTTVTFRHIYEKKSGGIFGDKKRTYSLSMDGDGSLTF